MKYSPLIQQGCGWLVQMNCNHCMVKRSWSQARNLMSVLTETLILIHLSQTPTASFDEYLNIPLPRLQPMQQYQIHWVRKCKTNFVKTSSYGKRNESISIRQSWKAHLERGTSPKFDRTTDLRGLKNNLQKPVMNWIQFHWASNKQKVNDNHVQALLEILNCWDR